MATETENGIEIETKTPNVIAPPSVSRLPYRALCAALHLLYVFCLLLLWTWQFEWAALGLWLGVAFLRAHRRQRLPYLPFPMTVLLESSYQPQHIPNPHRLFLYLLYGYLMSIWQKRFMAHVPSSLLSFLPPLHAPLSSTLDDYQSSRALAESQVKCAFNLSLVFFFTLLLPVLLTLYSKLKYWDFRFYLSSCTNFISFLVEVASDASKKLLKIIVIINWISCL